MYRSAENPILINEVPPHDVIDSVWRAVKFNKDLYVHFFCDRQFTSKYWNKLRHNFFNTRPITTESLSIVQQESFNSSHRK
jgi:hypothetical protein